MTKKLIFSAISLVMAINPMTAVVSADSGDWELIQSTAAWSYDDYKVEKLDFDGDAEGPLSLGSAVIVAEPIDTCDPNGCDRYHISVLENGMKMSIGNVPSETLDEQRYFALGEQFMYMDYSDEEQHYWNVVVVDLESGDESLELEDYQLDGVEDIDVMEEDGMFYFDPTFNWNNHTGYSNGVIYLYNSETDRDYMITDHWIVNRDELLDVQDGMVLSRMEFSSGYTQLWLYDTQSDPISMQAIPDTWTSPDEEIVGAHFRDDGAIEFFRMYERYVYEDGVTTAQGEYLSWFKDTDEALQVVNGRMAWLDPDDTLFVSNEDGVVDLGTLGYPQEFRLTSDAVYFASKNEGKVYDFASADTDEFPFVVTDMIDEAVVGVDAAGSIWYMDTDSGNILELGFGEDPVLSDPDHVYWRGEDGYVYEATIMIGALSDEDVRAVMVDGDDTVYLVMDETAYEIGNESVYFSWFESWSDVETVSASELNGFEDGGEATYAAGTKLKLVGDPKVYVVGDDGKLHWLITQTVAYRIYGSSWNQGIVEITQGDLTGLPYGTPILTESDIQSI